MKFDCAEYDGFSQPKMGYYNENDYSMDTIARMFWKKFPGLKGKTVRGLSVRGMRGVLMDDYVVVRTTIGLECVQRQVAHLKGKPYLGEAEKPVRVRRESCGTAAHEPRQKAVKPNLSTVAGIEAEIARLQAKLAL